MVLLIGDGDGLILSVIEVFFPIFVGLEEPKEDDDNEKKCSNGDNINHGIYNDDVAI